MKDKIISALLASIGRDGSKYNSNTPQQANIAIAQACTEYLISNTKVSVSYSGTFTSSGSPDIATMDLLLTNKINPPTGTSFADWYNSLISNICSGLLVITGPTTPTCSIFAEVASIPSFPNNCYDQNTAWGIVSNSIINFCQNSFIKSFPASRPGSVGVASVTKITIK